MKRIGDYLYEQCITGEWICIGKYVPFLGGGENLLPYL